MKHKKLLIILLALMLLLSACGDKNTNIEENGKTFEDSSGNMLVLEKTPEKIISLSPAVTEILFALNLEDKIIGTTDYCDYPEAAKDTPKMGGFNTPNIELILEAEPDLIFISAGVQAELKATFKNLGIKTFVLDANTIDQVILNIELVGSILNAEEKAKEISQDMINRKNFIKEKTKDLEKPLVFFEIWDEPLLSAGPNTFVSDILNIAGGINFSEEADSDYPAISLELLLEADPDYYIAVDHQKNEDIKNRPGYENLNAVKNNNYYRIEDDYVTLPGPRIIIGLEEVARIIHPEIFIN